MLVDFFAGGNGDLQAIARQRERTSGVGIVGAGRVVGFVEVEVDAFAGWPVPGRIRIDEARSGIGLFACGEVAKNDEEATGFFGLDFETKSLPVERKSEITDDFHFDGIAEDVLRIKLLEVIVRSIASHDVIGVVDGKPVQAGELFAEPAVFIFHADGKALAAGMNE